MKQIYFRFIAISLGLLVSLVLAELTLRIAGFEPWRNSTYSKDKPIMTKFDLILGWGNKSGHYKFPAYDGFVRYVPVTFLDDGSRATSESTIRSKSGKNVVLVGCSFTAGWAVSDHETYAWKLQERFPTANFYNYGTIAYGTYQSLLMLERVLPRIKSPKIVIYGFIVDHEVRNVAPAEYLDLVSRYAAAPVYVPYVTMGSDGELIRHAPDAMIMFPFMRYSALMTFAELYYMRFKTRGRLEQSHQVTEKLILEMQKLVNRYGAQLIVVLLEDTNDARKYFYQTFMKTNGVTCLDCSMHLTPDLIVPGDGHPKGLVHSFWADCISARLKNELH
jgi:hypothetical protein